MLVLLIYTFVNVDNIPKQKKTIIQFRNDLCKFLYLKINNSDPIPLTIAINNVSTLCKGVNAKIERVMQIMHAAIKANTLVLDIIII